MKIIKTIFFFIILFSFGGNSFAQSKVQSIDSLFMMAKKYTPVGLQKEKLSSKITDDSELEKIRKLLYNSLSNNPVEYHEKLLEWSEEWKQNILSGQVPRKSMSPAARIEVLKEAVTDKYGWDYVRFLETPYFMKVKVLEITLTTHHFSSRPFEANRINLKVQILDIVKSTNAYSIGDTLTVGYLPFWFRNTMQPSFKEGNIYALPMKNWGEGSIDNDGLMLKLNGLDTLYEIKNNTVGSPLMPEKAPSTSWESFKNEFKSKYIID